MADRHGAALRLLAVADLDRHGRGRQPRAERAAPVDGDDVYWTEGRPQEKGRQVIVRWNERDGAVDVTPPGFNARTMAHEYGGGWYAVDDGDGLLLERRGRPASIARSRDAPPVRAHGRPGRSATATWSSTAPARGCCACARTSSAEAGAARTTLVAIDLESGAVTVLASGYDFYNTPRPTRDGTSAGLAVVAPPQHALGLDRAVGRRARRRPAASQARRCRRRRRGIDRPAGVGARRLARLRVRSHGLVEPLPLARDGAATGRSPRWKPSSPGRCGSSA